MYPLKGVLLERGVWFTPQSPVAPVFPNWIYRLPPAPLLSLPVPPSRFLQPLVPECALFTCGTYPKGWQHYVHQKPKHIPHVHPSNYGADFCGDRCHFMGLCIPISVLHHTKSYRPFHSWQWPYWTWCVAHEGIKDWAENLSPLKIFCTYESIISLPYFMKSIKHDDVFTKVASKLSNTVLLPYGTILSGHRILIDTLYYCNTNVRCLSIETSGCF